MAQRLARAVAPLLNYGPLTCVTLDVTGTLIAFKGDLGDYYCLAAKAVGLPCPDYKRVHEGFKVAYTDMAHRFPCFGSTSNMTNREWWRIVVHNSFVKAGYTYKDEIFCEIFDRIYSAFGSVAPYTLLPDSARFLRWLREQGILVGLVSNSDYRYPNVILPALGLHKGSEWDFSVFSGVDGVEKPDPRMYSLALHRAGNISAQTTLHIGDSYSKDYLPAKSIGMNALLIDHFNTSEAKRWRTEGALVFSALPEAQTWIQDHFPVYGRQIVL